VRHVLERAARKRRGVVDEDLQASGDFDGAVDEIVQLVLVSKICAQRPRADAHPAERTRELFGVRGGVTIVDDDVDSLIGESQRDGTADSLGGSRDERGQPRECHA